LYPVDFRVEKIKHGKSASEKDITAIIYNPHITVPGISPAVYDYVVNSRPAIDCVMERQSIKTDKASGIVNDANRYATETLNNPPLPTGTPAARHHRLATNAGYCAQAVHAYSAL